MQKRIIEIIYKYLAQGWDDHQDEIMYLGPWTVLVGYPDADPTLVRKMAREIIEVIRGIDQAELITLPTRLQVMRELFDFIPDSDPSAPSDVSIIAHYASDFIQELRRPQGKTMWRGRSISEWDSKWAEVESHEHKNTL